MVNYKRSKCRYQGRLFSLNFQSENGQTALEIARLRGNLAIVDILEPISLKEVNKTVKKGGIYQSKSVILQPSNKSQVDIPKPR